MNTLFFVRHGDYSHKDGSLTQHGTIQSEVIGLKLAGRDRKYIIFTSPYTRATQTAKIIAAHINPFDVIEMEILKEHFPGEPYEELQERAYVTRRVTGGVMTYDVVIVSHRAVLRAIIHPLLNEDPKEIKIDKGMVYQFRNNDGKTRYGGRWGGGA